MSNPGASGLGRAGSGNYTGYQPSMYPQPIGTLSSLYNNTTSTSSPALSGTQPPSSSLSMSHNTLTAPTGNHGAIAGSAGGAATVAGGGGGGGGTATTLSASSSPSMMNLSGVSPAMANTINAAVAAAPSTPRKQLFAAPGMASVGGTTGLGLTSGVGSTFTSSVAASPAANALSVGGSSTIGVGAGTGAGKAGRPKGPYKKSGTGKRGGGGGGGRGGGHAGGQGGGGGGGGGSGSGGGGDRDRDDRDGGKDSDDDNEDEPEVSIEEQFILRLPPGAMCDRFREKVVAREIDESVKLRFKDARRGMFTFEGMRYPTKLVDLPTIIEAQKTLNGKQMYKIADISQMLIVDPIAEEGDTGGMGSLSLSSLHDASRSGNDPMASKPSDYIWPDGLSNPLKNVRKRRFRKRVSKVAVEGLENEIERLLQEDALAEEVRLEIREHGDGLGQFDSDDGAGTPAPGGQSDMDMEENDMMMDDDDEEEDDDQDDLDLLAEIEREIDAGENSSEGEEDDGSTPGPEKQSSGGVSQGGSSSTAGMGGDAAGSAKGSLSGSGGASVHGNLAEPSSHKSGSANAASTGGSKPSGAGTASSSSAAGNGTPTNKGKQVSRHGDEDEDEDEDEEDEEEEDDDEEDDDDDDEDDDSGSEEDDDDDEDDDEDDKEKAQLEKLLKDEIKDLNGKVKENEDKLQSAPNDILKRRFGSILENLRKELELKSMQLEEAKEKSKSKKK